MYKYIGIYGHRGAGKTTIAYLIGTAIEYFIKNRSFDEFRDVFNEYVNNIINNENIIQEVDLKHVYFEGFADTPKIMLAQFLGIPTEWLYSSEMKDSIIINIKDFSIHQYNNISTEIETYTAEKLSNIQINKEDDYFISLRELIIYFTKYTILPKWGEGVWVKSLRANNIYEDVDIFSNTIYKIFIDTKFSSEVSYIKDKNGKIVKVSRPKNYKKTKLNIAVDDERIDYEIVIDKPLQDLREDIENIVYKILKYD